MYRLEICTIQHLFVSATLQRRAFVLAVCLKDAGLSNLCLTSDWPYGRTSREGHFSAVFSLGVCKNMPNRQVTRGFLKERQVRVLVTKFLRLHGLALSGANSCSASMSWLLAALGPPDV